MRLRIALIGMSLLLFIAVLMAQKSGDDLFQQASGLEAKGDNPGAIKIYEHIVKDFASNHSQAARATLHLARLSDVLGQDKALAYYEKIVKEYPDQAASVAEARKWIDSHANTPIEITTSFTKDPWSFAISPDGKSLVILLTNGGTSSLCLLRRLDANKGCTPIRGTESSSYGGSPTGVTGANPFWSPDGHFIAYFEDRKLKTISVDGGTPKTLASAPNNAGGDWNGAGDIVFAPGLAGPLFRVSAKGEGEAVQLTGLDSTTSGHRYPRFLPDGRHFLIFPRTQNGTYGVVRIGSLDGGELTKLELVVSAVAFAPISHLVFAADNALHFQELDLQTMKPAGSPLVLTDHVAVYLGNSGRAAFSVSNAGPIAYRKSIAARRRVLWRDVLGKETSIGIQTPAANLTGTPRFSSNGHDVSFARNDDAFSSGIDVLNTDTGEFRNVEVGVNLFSGASPIWSSDGMFLAFAVQVGPVFQLFQQGIGTGPYGRTRILSSDESSLPTDWHGEFLLFTRTSTTSKGNVMVLSVPDGTEPIPIAATDAQEGNARFSPNGKWIVYESDELNGHYEIFVQPFPGTTNERRKVSSSGGTKAQWSWDGTSIYFLSPDGLLMAAGFTTSADGRDAVVKTPVSLFSVPVDSTYAPAPDGRFLMSEPTDSVPPIYVLPNPFGAKK